MDDRVISIVCNLDSRPGFLENESTEGLMMNGTRSLDFFVDGVLNKKQFFNEFNHEVIVFVDWHEPIPAQTLSKLMDMLNSHTIDVLAFSRHREYYNDHHFYPKHNDLNYAQAIALARGRFVAHFDSDVSAFKRDKTIIDEWLTLLDTNVYKFISYPSNHSPDAVRDPTFDYMWASTRFFLCTKKVLLHDETIKCLSDSRYLYDKYPASRHCPWYEHVISLINGGKGVFYPPIDYNRCVIFSWNHYKTGTIKRLQDAGYDEVKKFVLQQGGISYPCDLRA